MRSLHCAGCRRPFGVYLTEQLRSSVWCSAFCASQPAVTPNEVRDDLMVALSRDGRSDVRIGELFGVGRSRVQKVVAKRSGGPQFETE